MTNTPMFFGLPDPNFSESELRETCYELLLFTWRFSGCSVKKLLRLKTESSRRMREGDGGTGGSEKREDTIKVLIREQMRISKEKDLRISPCLSRIAQNLHGRRMESMVLPLELIQQYSQSDFPSEQEYEACLRRNFKLLEAGLLLLPHIQLDKAGTSKQEQQMHIQQMDLQTMINKALENPIVFQSSRELMQTFQTTVMSLASSSSDGPALETMTCHWADGYPLNLQIYQTLLGACFDIHEETYVIEEADVVLKLFKKTWVMLGINEMLHNLCFSWVLFHRYVVTGQVENDLLFASSRLLAEVEKDTKAMKDPLILKTVNSGLGLILRWADKRLLGYHKAFHNGKIESMEGVVSLAVSSALILAECNSKGKEADEPGTRAKNCIRSYIRSSLGRVFAQRLEELNPSKHPSRKQNGAFRFLSDLAGCTAELALNEKEIFSPKLKRWHPLAAGVAAATLHKLYGEEWKKHVESITSLTSDAIRVLLAAEKLEKDLVQIAVEDSCDSEDGGTSVIREIQPYEAGALLIKLVKSWIKIRVDGLGEWVARNLQREVWSLQADEKGFVPSTIDVLKVIVDTVKEFLLLPIPMHAVLLPDLMSGLDMSFQKYILKATFGYGNRNTFIPTLPALTRGSLGSKFPFVKKEKSKSANRGKAQVGTPSEDNSFDIPPRRAHVGTTSADNSFEIPKLFVRINTMQLICMGLEALENLILNDSGIRLKFKLSSAASVEGIHQLCEYIAYKVVFKDLRHVLWDGLYVEEVSSTRIEPFLQELERYLKIISSTPMYDEVKTRVITEVMQASFDGFLLVLLAGGPSRAFSLQDSTIIEEDFNSLTDLFCSNGDRLSDNLIQKRSSTVRAVLPLFRADTKHIIQQLTQLTKDIYGSSFKSQFQLPPTSGLWSPEEPDTLLRVLCYRNDSEASKFLKEKYKLPTQLPHEDVQATDE